MACISQQNSSTTKEGLGMRTLPLFSTLFIQSIFYGRGAIDVIVSLLASASPAHQKELRTIISIYTTGAHAGRIN